MYELKGDPRTCFFIRNFLIALTMVFVFSINFSAQEGATDGQWQFYAGDIGSTKYAPLDQINHENVQDLRMVWQRPAVDQSILEKAPNLSYGKKPDVNTAHD